MIRAKVSERVSDLLKLTVENRHGEKLGRIQDLMVGVDGRLKYAILCHGGFLDIGDVLIPIPFDLLMTAAETGTAVLDMDKQTLEKALNFESKTWPDFTAAEWEEKIDRYFSAHPACAVIGNGRKPLCQHQPSANRFDQRGNNVCRTTNRRRNRSRLERA